MANEFGWRAAGQHRLEYRSGGDPLLSIDLARRFVESAAASDRETHQASCLVLLARGLSAQRQCFG